MLSTILLVLVLVIAVILAIAATKPNSFKVERSARIEAPPEKIFPLINDFRRWGAWSPWEHVDPDMKRTFSGPDSGVGSIYEWEGNNKAGKGRMEITQSRPSSHVSLNLDFIKPFKASNVTEFDFVPNGNATDFRWVMHGPSPFVTKIMMVFTTMDKMIGKDFDQGIVNLKKAAASL